MGFSGALAGKTRMMENALRKAADADRGDPYEIYEAAAKLIAWIEAHPEKDKESPQ